MTLLLLNRPPQSPSSPSEAASIFEPASLHRYLYANADSVNNSDPSGQNNMPEILTVIAVELLILIASWVADVTVTALTGNATGGLYGADDASVSETERP